MSSFGRTYKNLYFNKVVETEILTSKSNEAESVEYVLKLATASIIQVNSIVAAANSVPGLVPGSTSLVLYRSSKPYLLLVVSWKLLSDKIKFHSCHMLLYMPPASALLATSAHRSRNKLFHHGNFAVPTG